jgi:predicted permease
MRALFTRFHDLFRRRAISRAFDEEMSFHLAELERRQREGGASPEDARAAAMREFGNVLQAREDLRARAGFPSWDELVNDFRHAVRGVIRRPWLAGSVVVMIALGLGAAATIYGLVDAVFLRPLPVSYPEELFAVQPADPKVPNRLSRGTVRRLEAALPGRTVAAYGGGDRCAVQIGSQAAAWANVRLVNGNFFAALGLAPDAGRLLSDADDVAGAPAMVAVVSSAWARKNFETAEAAVGRELSVNRTPVTIAGVLPASFRGVSVGQTTDLWFATAVQPRLRVYGNSSESVGDDRPNDPDWNREERISWLQILVRVRPGTAASAALQRAWEPQRDELSRTVDDAREREKLKRQAWILVPAPGGQSRLRESFRSTSLLLGGVVGVMLVLVCTNVSGLLLVRSMARHREIGVRLALGAGSLRVVRLGFFEALVLSGVGGLAGWILAAWLLPAAVHLLIPGESVAVVLGVRSVALMTALALVSAVLSAFAPALWISRVEPLNALSGNRGLGRAPIRLGRMLVVAQFAIAVALVALAAALGGELQRVLAADPGFNRDHVVTAVFDPASAGYERPAIFPLLDRMRRSVLGVPGVTGVSFSFSGILAGSQSSSGIYLRDPRALVHQENVQHDAVLPGYFGVVGMPLLLGRDFAESDKADALPVAVVSASFAREFFGETNPIGQSFGFDSHPTKDDRVVVGVVSDVHLNGVREAAPAMFFTPAAQSNDGMPQFIAVRFDGSEAAIQGSLRDVLARAEPGLVLTSWKTLQQRMSDDLRGELVTTRLAAIFGACAVLLAGAGVAGSLGYLVVLRQRELALRIAIGAAPGRLFRSVVADALRLSVIGGAFGVLAVWLVPKLPAVKGVLSTEPGLGPALAAAAIALVTATIAGSIPARRASRIDPIQILKLE